jgi:hypothetical protein
LRFKVDAERRATEPAASAHAKPHSDRWRFIARGLEDEIEETRGTNGRGVLLEKDLEYRDRGWTLHNGGDTARPNPRTNELDARVGDEPLKPRVRPIPRGHPLVTLMIDDPDLSAVEFAIGIPRMDHDDFS